MKIALLTKYNNYCGREYAKKLEDHNINYNLITFSNKSNSNKIEEVRTNGNWKPQKITDLKNYKIKHYNFKTIKSKSFLSHLIKFKYDVGIQGGVEEKIKSEIINKFKFGIINMHPGDIASYRGSSAPERQILNKEKIKSCCHLLTEELDMGDILSLKQLKLDYSSYFTMRSSLYPNLSNHMIYVIKKIIRDQKIKIIKKAPKNNNKIYKFIGDQNIKKIIKMMDS